MEKAHWIARKRASLKMAEEAGSSEARLIHYDLAGRYSVKAADTETQPNDLAEILPPPLYSSRKRTRRRAA